MIEPKVEDLLRHVDNHYTLVVLAARRARQITDYYTKLGAGSLDKPMPPLLDSIVGLKPLAQALREVDQEKIGYVRPAGTEESVK